MQNEKLGGLHCWMSFSNKSLGGRVFAIVCVCVCVWTVLLDECFQQKSRWACMCMCMCVSWIQNEKLGGLHCWMSVSNKSLGGRVFVIV